MDNTQRFVASLSSTPKRLVGKFKPAPVLAPSIQIISESCTCPRCAPELYESLMDLKNPLSIANQLFKGCWYHSSYRVAELAALSFSSGPRTFAHRRVMSDWKQFWKCSREYSTLKCARNLSKHDPEDLLKKPLEIFNQVFFVGQLPKRYLRVRWLNDPRLRGRCNHTEEMSFIYLNPDLPVHRHNPTALLGTLLHEMLHVFMGWNCCHDPMCAKRACRLLYAQNYGVKGHGRAWQYLARAIEDAAPLFLPGFKAYLGRNEAAIIEIKNAGWRPSPCDFAAVLESQTECRVKVCLGRKARDDDDVLHERLDRWIARAIPEEKPHGLRKMKSTGRLGVFRS